MAGTENSTSFVVESYDYAQNRATFTWKGDDADEAVAQFISAMDSAHSIGSILTYNRDRAIAQTLAEAVSGGSVFHRLVGHHRITLTRTTNPDN